MNNDLGPLVTVGYGNDGLDRVVVSWRVTVFAVITVGNG